MKYYHGNDVVVSNDRGYIDYESAVAAMEPDLREEVHAWALSRGYEIDEQAFFDEYADRYESKYSDIWECTTWVHYDFGSDEVELR